MTTPAQRHTLGALMDYLVAHEPKVHYAQRRPMRSRWITDYVELTRAVQSGAGLTMDCSESVTLLCKLAGLDDPNGLRYNGSGYTGTLLDHLPHYTPPSKANISGLPVLAARAGAHTAIGL